MGNQISLIVGERMFAWSKEGRCLSRAAKGDQPFSPCRAFDMPGGVEYAMASNLTIYLFNTKGECFTGNALTNTDLFATEENPTKHNPLARFPLGDCNVERADAFFSGYLAERRAVDMQADIDEIAQIEAQAEAAAQQIKAQAEALKARKANLKASQAEFQTHAKAAGEFAPAEPK